MANIKEFKKDINKIQKILPKKLKAIKINFVSYGLANFSQGLNLNFNGLINETNLKKAFEKYLHKKLNTRQYIIYVILHEFGHAFRHITEQANYNQYRQQSYFLTLDEDYIKRQLNYWHYITEEKYAWQFAKKYIKNIHLTKAGKNVIL